MRNVSIYLFALLTMLTLAASCEKEEHETRNDQQETPKTTVPDAYTGKWMGGYFDMSAFWNYDGNRLPDATNMVAYNIKKDGTAEQFIYYNYDDGSDKQVLTYRKGTVTFDEASATLKFCPSEGQFRLFENGQKTEDDLSASGLYPTYAPKYRHCTFEEDNNITYLVGTSDQNEIVGFAKANW